MAMHETRKIIAETLPNIPLKPQKKKKKKRLVLWIIVCIPAGRIVIFPTLLRVQVDGRMLDSIWPFMRVVVTLGRCVALIHDILMIWIRELSLWLIYGRSWGNRCREVSHWLGSLCEWKLLRGARLLDVNLVWVLCLVWDWLTSGFRISWVASSDSSGEMLIDLGRDDLDHDDFLPQRLSRWGDSERLPVIKYKTNETALWG